MSSNETTFYSIFNDFNELTLNPELFLEKAPEEAQGFKTVAKKLYDHATLVNSLTNLKAKSLPKLLTEGFHEEQIWQQIELQNNSAVSHFSNNISKINANNLVFGVDEKESVSLKEDAKIRNSDAESSVEEDDHLYNEAPESNDESINFDHEKELSSEEDSNEEMEAETGRSLPEKKSCGNETENYSADDKPKSSNNDRSEKKSKRLKNKSVVDDQFFKLLKLEQFLRREDLKEERARDEDLELSGDEEEIDLFQDIPSDDGDEDEDSEEEEVADKKSSRDLMYEDFFDAPESGDENIIDEDKESELGQNSNLSDDENDFLNEGDLEEGDQEKELQPKAIPDKHTKQNSMTPFQLQQEKIKQQIESYEKSMLKPAAWHLTGEVDAMKRPTDALLHLQTDFEMNAKPVVLQDKDLCDKLENMLKNTIKNKAYSDGVKQYKTNDEIIAYKKEAVIEEKKSQKSLAQEYEDMYLKKQHKQDEEENPKHKEIKKLMDSLFPELHALFSHIPKPAIPDIKIVSNLPAVTVEEVAPTSVSDVTLLAPEEIKKRTGRVKGQSERTDTDKKRERRKKKAFQKMKQKKREKENSDDKPLSAKAQKREKVDMLRKLKQHRNTKIANVTGEKVKSTKDFFAKLQDTVSSTVNKVQARKVKKKKL